MADRKGLFASIETREDALKLVRDGSKGFFLLAGLQTAIGIFLMPAALIDAAILTVLALIILKTHARPAALILLLVVSLEAGITLLNRLGMMTGGGTNIFLAAIMVILAVRMVEATFKLNGQFKSVSAPRPAPPRAPALQR